MKRTTVSSWFEITTQENMWSSSLHFSFFFFFSQGCGGKDLITICKEPQREGYWPWVNIDPILFETRLSVFWTRFSEMNTLSTQKMACYFDDDDDYCITIYYDLMIWLFDAFVYMFTINIFDLYHYFVSSLM